MFILILDTLENTIEYYAYIDFRYIMHIAYGNKDMYNQSIDEVI